jgi:hypothetical protein
MSDTRIVLWFAWFLAASWLRRMAQLFAIPSLKGSNS